MSPLNFKRNLGLTLLGIWLLLSGLLPLLNVTIPLGGTLMAALAIAAGICILAGR
jgi:hypothetical protein